MKNIYLILLTFTSCFPAVCQQLPKSNVANIIIPKEATKLTKEQTISLIKANFKHPKKISNYDNIYNIDGIVISVSDEVNMQDYNYTIENQKAETESLYKRNKQGKIIQSKIISINNELFYVFEHEEDDEITLSFMCDFKNKKTFFCSLNYKEINDDKAKNFFNMILKSFKYKK
jgi:hypothetical protein